MSSYSFSRLCASYGGRQALDSLSGDIRAGCITAIIGPNGGGKSTLLRALGGLYPYAGELSLDGRSVCSIPRNEFGRRVGVLPQTIEVRAAFTVWEIIALGRLPYRGPFEPLRAEDDRAVFESASEAGVESLLFRRAAELSGGERQRVLFARVLAQRPEIFLLDEPTSALDPSHTRGIFRLLGRLAKAGKTIVAAAHDLNSAIALSDRFIALRDGRAVASGAVSEIDEALLEELYGIKFRRYLSKEGNTAWHPE